jgi:hypothetical protein
VLNWDRCTAGREPCENFAAESAGNLWNERVDRLTVLCYTASSVVHAWEFVYDLSAVGSSYQRHEPFVPS